MARWQGERTIGRLPEPVVTDSFGQVGAGDEQLSLVVLGDELAAAAGFAETMERIVVDTVEAGDMTKDLALLVGPDQRWLTTEGFLDKVAENLRRALPEVG